MIWTVGSLALLAAGVGSRCAGVLEQTLRQERRLQARYIALAGVQSCLQALDTDTSPSYDGLSETWAHSGLVDEDRKINLNKAPPDVLRRLLAAAGAVEADQDVIVDSIADWRDKDHEKGPYGAESFYYLGLDPAYECKDGPFESIEELLFVRGMTPELFSVISPSVTVHGSGRVNLNTAGPDVLRALGLSEQGVQGILFYQAGEDNQPGTPDDRALSAISAAGAELAQYIPAEDIARLAQLDAAALVGVKSQDFAFDITGRVNEDEQGRDGVRLIGVMDRKGKVKAWAER